MEVGAREHFLAPRCSVKADNDLWAGAEGIMMEKLNKAYFGTGCFWGAERKFWLTEGVFSTSVGYMGGTLDNPSYQAVCSGTTGHAEVVEVIFDPSIVSYRELLALFWVMHDPTSYNRQGNDVGSQYRSVIFTSSPDQEAQAYETMAIYQEVLDKSGYGKICTEISSTQDFAYWPAESYHQRYLAKNPNGYDCHSSTGVAYPEKFAKSAS